MHRFAAFWLAAFALVHAYWALGGRVGVPAGSAAIGSRPVFLAYDVVAGLALVVLAVIAYRQRLPRVLLAAAAMLLVRGVVGLGQDAAGAGTALGAVYDVWFAATGAALVLSARNVFSSRRTVATSLPSTVSSAV